MSGQHPAAQPNRQKRQSALDDGCPEVLVLLGRCDEMRAEVYARLVARPSKAGAGRLSLVGTLVGPRCGTATTLPITVSWIDAAGGANVMARAVLMEPSYWTPELPNLYDVDLQVIAEDRPLMRVARAVGLRRLGVRGRSLWLEGRRWVLRGVSLEGENASGGALQPHHLAALHEQQTAGLVCDPDSALCAAADRLGVALAAILLDEARQNFAVPVAAERITAWAQHPSVALVILPRQLGMLQAAELAEAVRYTKGTLLLGLEVDAREPPPTNLPAGIDCLVAVLTNDHVPHDAWRALPPVPVLAWRQGGAAGGARTGCDALQAALAGWGMKAVNKAGQIPWDWAGYLVS